MWDNRYNILDEIVAYYYHQYRPHSSNAMEYEFSFIYNI